MYYINTNSRTLACGRALSFGKSIHFSRAFRSREVLGTFDVLVRRRLGHPQRFLERAWKYPFDDDDTTALSALVDSENFSREKRTCFVVKLRRIFGARSTLCFDEEQPCHGSGILVHGLSSPVMF